MAAFDSSGFSIDDLFQISDNRVPLGIQPALKGLITPFESIFPNSRVPDREQAASEFNKVRQTSTPTQPPDFEMKKDWIEWILWELRLRLVLADRFNAFRNVVPPKGREKDGRLLLFLREFREVNYNVEAGIHQATQTEKDSQLRDKIELMFTGHPVLWIANPRDDLNRSFYNELYQQKVNDNSIPYLASEDWLEAVRLLAQAADIIVMSNTKQSGGVGQEIALLKESGFLDKTFFANPDLVDAKGEQLKSIDDLTLASLQHATSGEHSKLLELPPLRHWMGRESMEYAGYYVEVLDICAGESKGLGTNVSYDIFAAVFMALSALLIARAELKAAAGLQKALAQIIQKNPESFGYYDVYAVDALLDSASWYESNEDHYCTAHALKITAKPKTK